MVARNVQTAAETDITHDPATPKIGTNENELGQITSCEYALTNLIHSRLLYRSAL